ncbi:glycosyltransferase family 25 protein [Acidaminococcus timonensis]|jgi:glycosyl transferase, family 25|uniref:glycosyltransferase family 25 protein n=1 Tax=Acidaminococcus timonensis TaxID=1871002 RepID=UPI003A5C5500
MQFYHFIISAEEMSNRKKNCMECFTRLGIQPCFLDAVMGKNLSQDELRNLAHDNGLLKVGAIGCALSHLKAYRQFLQSKEKCAYIFEDDAQLTEKFIALQPEIQKFMEKQTKPTVLALYRFDGLKRKIQDLDHEICIMRSFGGTASHAYVINRSAAENLLRAQTPVRIEFDAWAIYQKLGFINLYCLNKDVVILNDALSQESTIEVKPNPIQSNPIQSNQNISMVSESDAAHLKAIKKGQFHFWYQQLPLNGKIKFHLRRILRHIQEIYYERD